MKKIFNLILFLVATSCNPSGDFDIRKGPFLLNYHDGSGEYLVQKGDKICHDFRGFDYTYENKILSGTGIITQWIKVTSIPGKTGEDQTHSEDVYLVPVKFKVIGEKIHATRIVGDEKMMQRIHSSQRRLKELRSKKLLVTDLDSRQWDNQNSWQLKFVQKRVCPSMKKSIDID